MQQQRLFLNGQTPPPSVLVWHDANMTISTQIKKKKKKLIVWLRPSWEILRPELCFHETAAEKKMSKVL
jgi:hypothetical protein